MRGCGALAACAVLVAGAAAAQDVLQDPPRLAPGSDANAHRAWAARYLQQDDWTIAGFVNGGFWLVSSEISPHNHYPTVQDWVRIEQAGPLNPQLPNASALWQTEVDCSKSAYRTLRYINYRYNNLRGAVLGDRTDDKATFITPPPQSVGDAVVQAICKDAASGAPPSASAPAEGGQ